MPVYLQSVPAGAVCKVSLVSKNTVVKGSTQTYTVAARGLCRVQCPRAARSRLSAATPAGRSATSSSPASIRPPGATVFEQMQALQPTTRCGASCCVSRAARRDARQPDRSRDARDCAAGFIIMEPTEYPAMSGSNTICVATVLLETGLVAMLEPETMLRLEAPAGVVEIRAACRNGRVRVSS